MASLLQQTPEPIYSFDEYLELEEQAEFKSEFLNGRIVAMSGGTPTHARLAIRLGGMFDRLMPNCQVYSSDLKLYIESVNRAFYPDVMVLCGSVPRFWKGRNDVIINPTLAVEVLSPSTEKFDRESKTLLYRSVPTMQHILLVFQDLQLVDHFERRDADSWTVKRYNEGAVPIAGVEISLGELYNNILHGKEA